MRTAYLKAIEQLTAGNLSMEDVQFTATLANWRWSEVHPRSLVGYIYDDTCERFQDGDSVITSAVSMVNFEQGWALTRNSFYRLALEE